MLPTPKLPVAVRRPAGLTSAVALAALFLAGPLASSAHAAAAVPPMGTTSAFSVLAGSTITNTGTTVIDRSIGVHPGTAVTGQNTMTLGGTAHKGDAVALQAKTDLTAAYNDLAGQTPPTDAGPELGGLTLVGGVYKGASELHLTGPLTLDGAGDPNSVWVFQAPSTLITAPGATVLLTGRANPCNVFWQVGSSATLDTTTRFVGTIMAEATITMNTGATLQGRALARSGAVNLHNNVFTSPDCAYDVGVADAEDDPPEDTDTAAGNDDTDRGNGSVGNGSGDGSGNLGSRGAGDDFQVATVPTGSVDTGVAGHATGAEGAGSTFTGVAFALGFGGLALVAVRRRRVM